MGCLSSSAKISSAGSTPVAKISGGRSGELGPVEAFKRVEHHSDTLERLARRRARTKRDDSEVPQESDASALRPAHGVLLGSGEASSKLASQGNSMAESMRVPSYPEDCNEKLMAPCIVITPPSPRK